MGAFEVFWLFMLLTMTCYGLYYWLTDEGEDSTYGDIHRTIITPPIKKVKSEPKINSQLVDTLLPETVKAIPNKLKK